VFRNIRARKRETVLRRFNTINHPRRIRRPDDFLFEFNTDRIRSCRGYYTNGRSAIKRNFSILTLCSTYDRYSMIALKYWFDQKQPPHVIRNAGHVAPAIGRNEKPIRRKYDSKIERIWREPLIRFCRHSTAVVFHLAEIYARISPLSERFFPNRYVSTYSTVEILKSRITSSLTIRTFTTFYTRTQSIGLRVCRDLKKSFDRNLSNFLRSVPPRISVYLLRTLARFYR